MRLPQLPFFCACLLALPFLSQADAPPQPTTVAPTVFLEDDAGQPHPKGAYHFKLRTSLHEAASARVLVARSSTPDFSKSQWQAVPLKGARFDTLTGGEADIPLGSKALRYVAVRGDIEVKGKDGAPAQRYASAVTVLPEVRVWSNRKDDGSRAVYLQPSESAPTVKLWLARSATRDFEHAQWQTLTVTPPDKPNAWDDYSSTVPPALKATPYIAVYAEAAFAGTSKPTRVISPTIIWNGLPLPANAADLTTPVCPLHGTGEGVVPVIYGLPGAGAPTDAVFAGCIVGPGSPTWHCKLCDCSWGDEMARMAKPK